MSGGGPMPGIMELKRRVDSGELERSARHHVGSCGSARLRARRKKRARKCAALTAAGRRDRQVVGDAGKRTSSPSSSTRPASYGLDVMVHAVTVPAMIAAVEAGAAKLVHTPHDSFLTNEQAKMVAAAGIENLSTVGFAVPRVRRVQRRQRADVSRRQSVAVGHLGHGLERRGRKARECAHAVGQRRGLRFRHRHELPAARGAEARAQGAELDVLADRYS